MAVDGILYLEWYINFSHIDGLFHFQKCALSQYYNCRKTDCLGRIPRDLKNLCRSLSCYQFYSILPGIGEESSCGQYLNKRKNDFIFHFSCNQYNHTLIKKKKKEVKY